MTLREKKVVIYSKVCFSPAGGMFEDWKTSSEEDKARKLWRKTKLVFEIISQLNTGGLFLF